MKEELKYQSLEVRSDEVITSILEGDDINKLILLPLEAGMNHPDWKFAQDLCLQLVNHEDWRVQANALKGLEYIARTRGKLEKHLVKPVLLKYLKSEVCEQLDVAHITRRINNLLGWRIGRKEIERQKQSR